MSYPLKGEEIFLFDNNHFTKSNIRDHTKIHFFLMNDHEDRKRI
jgi:hypothetical protein